MNLTFVDAGVLIAAARGGNVQAARAMEILDDPDREFAASAFLRLEVLPQAVFDQRVAETALISRYHWVMGQLVVRQLDDEVKAKLQRRARRHGRSTEEEVREILGNAVRDEGAPRTALGSRLAARFERIGLTEEIPELRGQAVQPAELEE